MNTRFVQLAMILILGMSGLGYAEDAPKAVGDHFGGGIVFYVTSSGLHGLICEATDRVVPSNAHYDEVMAIAEDASLLKNGAEEFTDWRMPNAFEVRTMQAVNKKQPTLLNLKGFYLTSELNRYGETISAYLRPVTETGELKSKDMFGFSANLRLVRAF